MGSVMIPWISALPSPEPMVPPVTMVCIVRKMSSAVEGCVLLTLSGTVLGSPISVIMGSVMIPWISVLPSQEPMVVPVRMVYSAQSLTSVQVAHVMRVPPEIALFQETSVTMGSVMIP